MIKKFFLNLFAYEQTASKLALSFCIGNCIAWSTTIPFQTPLVIGLSWLLNANMAISIGALYLINNPLTLVPIYCADYMFGYWFFKYMLKIDIIKYNPSWTDTLSAFLNKYVSLERICGEPVLSFWALIMGGFVFPIVLSVLLYPIMRIMFSFIFSKIKNSSTKGNSLQ